MLIQPNLVYICVYACEMCIHPECNVCATHSMQQKHDFLYSHRLYRQYSFQSAIYCRLNQTSTENCSLNILSFICFIDSYLFCSTLRSNLSFYNILFGIQAAACRLTTNQKCYDYFYLNRHVHTKLAVNLLVKTFLDRRRHECMILSN